MAVRGVKYPTRRKHIVRTALTHPPPSPQPTPCRLWQGVVFVGTGYGRRSSGIERHQHRWVWEQINGPIPAGMVVAHKCDNPPCYRYDHLELITPGQNIRDASARRRMQKLTLEQEDEICTRYALGGISQSTLASEFGCSQAHVSHLINRPRRTTHDRHE